MSIYCNSINVTGVDVTCQIFRDMKHAAVTMLCTAVADYVNDSTIFSITFGKLE